MTERTPPDVVVLVPGLFSPRWMMTGLRRALTRAGLTTHTWDDASVFGPLDISVDRLHDRLSGLSDRYGSLRVVTHSFGDWLLRQALATAAPLPVVSLVSLAPVMTSSLAARAVAPLGAIAPELGVMADRERAAAALQIPEAIDWLVVWASVDPWVRRVPELPGATHRTVTGTHNSIVFQAHVHDMVIEHLQRL